MLSMFYRGQKYNMFHVFQVRLECISVIYDPDDTVVCNECQKQQEQVKIFFHETLNDRI